MALITLAEALAWCGVTEGYFTIAAGNNELVLTSSEGSATITVADGTYEPDDAATALETAMNADNTLTGTGTITFDVTFSSTTKKFTIDADTGNTIAYTNLNSDGGIEFGFNSDKSAAQTITSDLETGDPTEDVSQIHLGVEEWVKNTYCHRDFEATDYIEYQSAHGEFFTKQFPIISLSRVITGTMDGIKITSDTTDSAYATAYIISTGVVLKISGGASSGENTVDFATYTTLGAIATQINNLTGWSAELADSDYSLYSYTDLWEEAGLRFDDYDYLQIPEDDVIDFDVEVGTGEISWIEGRVRIEYRAGFETIPEDLKLAVKILIRNIFDRKRSGSLGTNTYSSGAINQAFYDDLPPNAKIILDRYVRGLI